MSTASPDPDTGWGSRVSFAEHEQVAFSPGVVIVPQTEQQDVFRSSRDEEAEDEMDGFVRIDLVLGESFMPVDTLEYIRDLRAEGVRAQPDHVFFADCDCFGGCPPHPATGAAMANPFAANPFAANPFAANPFAANPFAANPFAANPFAANPFAANPFAANGWPRPETRATGPRASSARPAAAPKDPLPQLDDNGSPVVLVLDTGLAHPTYRPASLQTTASGKDAEDVPDDNGDLLLDPAAGHGTFIAGIVGALAPGARVIHERVLTGLGDGSEWEIARTLLRYAGKVDLVNLSFSTYTPFRPGLIARAVRAIQRGARLGTTPDPGAKRAVVVASAGNDATCVAPYPARLPDVVAVAALGEAGAAPFTNYGSWVTACAPGTDVVCTFFDGFESGVEPSGGSSDPDRYEGWARWSGTSFAAPTVVGALAREMQIRGCDARDARRRVIDAEGLLRLPGLGTVVNYR